MNKKDFPLAVLEALKGFVHRRGETFEIINPDNMLLKVIDNDEKSSFYFNIEGYEKQQTAFKLLMDRKPKSNVNNGNYRTWIDVKDLENQFSLWLGLLDGYNNIESFFDDPILKSFATEFYSEFEFIDDEAQINPLTVTQVLLLDKHLEYIELNIENLSTEKNKEQLNEIKKDVIELRENLIKPKAWVGKKLSIIWGKIAKQGPKFIKEFLVEGKKQLIIESVKSLLSQGVDYIS